MSTEIKVEDKAMDVLDRLSTKLKTPITELYTVMVKQVKVDAINSAVATLFLAVLGLVIKSFWNLLLPSCVPGLQGDGSWPTQVLFQFVILTGISIVWAYFIFTKSLFCVQQCIGAWLNPQGVAFNRIIRYFN